MIDSAAVARVGASVLEDDIDRAARTDDHVLIVGESATASDVVARLIHRRSRRAAAPVRTLHCAGLPAALLESELFGHRRGSFPGAYCDKTGLVDVAANGTLILLDVAEMNARVQAELMRFLDVGNVRIIAAANGHLRSQIAAGVFREDLYARLNAVSLQLRPLREHPEDIPMFVDFFLHAEDGNGRRRRSISDAAMQLLVRHDWPGDVGELRNVADRLELLVRGPLVEPADLPAEVRR